MDIEHYEDHLMELEQVLKEALRRVARDYPEHEDDLYIVALDVDGQYHKVTVGVSNVRDETVSVDSTRLIARGTPAAGKVLTAEERTELHTHGRSMMPDEDTLRQAEDTAREDCRTAYSILDELLDQLFEAASELRLHKIREHDDIIQMIHDIRAVARTKHLVQEFVDPDGPPSEDGSSPTIPGGHTLW